MSATGPYIFIDTCSLLDSCWNRQPTSSGSERFIYCKEKDDKFWGEELRSLEGIGQIIIPLRNYEEMKKHSANAQKPGLASRARFILHRIDELCAARRIEVVGDPNDPFADAILLSVALKFRTQNNMAFITQDRGLAEDLESIRRFRSVKPRKGYDIKIRRIGKSGAIEPHRGLGKSFSAPKGKRESEASKQPRAQVSSSWNAAQAWWGE